MRCAVGLLFLSGCLYSRAAEVPMPMQMHSAGSSPKGVFVFLPGLGDQPEKFVEHGFVEKVNALGFDAVTVDAHFGYYRERILEDRLDADVIAKLRASYSQIWLVGISLGGFGSVRYATDHEGVAGLILLAPFLGDEDAWTPIEQAGGLAKWEPGPPLEDQDERVLQEMWTWLKGYAGGEPRPMLLLGYGDEDRFRRPGGLLASVLPAERVAVVPGGHKWTTWKVAFSKLLATLDARPTTGAQNR
jgi:pimeloyl-ACP methyl ester carboxylesterase